MKKLILSFFLIFTLLFTAAVSVSAAKIELYTPSVDIEFAPTRDFYIVGSIDRDGASAAELPLNIKIELFNSENKLVRELISNVLPTGITSAEFFLSDYPEGFAANDLKGSSFAEFTPPDIIYDGFNRDTVRLAHNKIVVKDDYFAAIIFGGNSKEYELNYTDKYDSPLTNLESGTYSLVITALDLESNVLDTYKQEVNFGTEKERVIAQEEKYISEYAKDNNMSLNSDFPGLWIPCKYTNAPDNFTYSINQRYISNFITEYKNTNNISILLYNLDLRNKLTNLMLGSAYSSKSEKSFLYYDIGEDKVEYSFNETALSKEGNIVKHSQKEFIELLRTETKCDSDTYVDFDLNDGIVLTEYNKTDFYGVFSPVIKSSSLQEDIYQIVNNEAYVHYTVTDTNNKLLLEGYTDTQLTRKNQTTPSMFEFSFAVTPDKAMSDKGIVYLYTELCDAEKKPLIPGKIITMHVNKKGAFIDGYSDKDWCKAFCDTVNNLGASPVDAIKPGEYITRGSFAAMINRLFGYGVSDGATFKDLTDKSVYYNDCSTAQTIGYMTGDENGNVKADDYISREQAIIILARISEAEMGDKEITFKDDKRISFWAKDYVDKLSSNGIVSGFDGYLNPTENINGSEAAALIIKTYKWMYNGSLEAVSAPIEDTKLEMPDTELTDVEFIENVNGETLKLFFNSNADALSSVALYLQTNFPNGIYITKVGKGLEMRDYKMGSYVKLSENALSLLTDMSKKFENFSVRYNPKNEEAIHFVLGENNGLTYTRLIKVDNKALEFIANDWYYFVQE